ncbi:MAG: hypothetical protein RIQ36_649 [Pseudomonadota bacterium]|jgi:hypothetical protein
MTVKITAVAALCAIFTFGPNTPTLAADTAWAVSPAWSQSSDSDGLTIRKAFAAALPSFTNGLKWQGVEWQEQRYQQNGNSLSGHGVNYTAQDLDALSGMGYSLKLGVNQGPDKTTAIGEWNYNRAYNAQLHWGVFASRDWVESMNALQRGIHYDLVGGNVDYQVHPRVTVVGSLAQTHFSDGQDRQQQRARAVWDAWPDQGITLQWAYKHQLGNANGAASGNYFNPDRLNESMGLIGWRRRYEGWQWYARLGEGRQTVNNDGSTPARLAELQLTSPVRGSSYFKLRAGRSETVGIYSGNTGYVYRYLDAQWIWPLGR